MPRTFVSRNKQTGLPVYLDCNATAPMEPAVVEVLRNHLETCVASAMQQGRVEEIVDELMTALKFDPSVTGSAGAGDAAAGS